jgi:hypothetical protein
MSFSLLAAWGGRTVDQPVAVNSRSLAFDVEWPGAEARDAAAGEERRKSPAMGVFGGINTHRSTSNPTSDRGKRSQWDRENCRMLWAAVLGHQLHSTLSGVRLNADVPRYFVHGTPAVFDGTQNQLA